MNFKKIKKNLRKDARAISPIIATLLLIAIAVVAALVVYAWVMGYMSFTTNKTGQSIQIQSVAPTGPATAYTGLNIYVQNVGNSAVKFSVSATNAVSGVYVNGVMAAATNPTGSLIDSSGTLAQSSTGTINIATSTSFTFKSGDSLDIKVSTISGTYSEMTWIVP